MALLSPRSLFFCYWSFLKDKTLENCIEVEIRVSRPAVAQQYLGSDNACRCSISSGIPRTVSDQDERRISELLRTAPSVNQLRRSRMMRKSKAEQQAIYIEGPDAWWPPQGRTMVFRASKLGKKFVSCNGDCGRTHSDSLRARRNSVRMTVMDTCISGNLPWPALILI